MSTLKYAYGWMTRDLRHVTGARMLQIAIGLQIWFRITTEYRYAVFLYGPHGMGYGDARSIFGAAGACLLNAPFQSDIGTRIALMVFLASAGGLVLGVAVRISTVVALLCAVVFNARYPEIGDGGDNVTRVVLVYMLFLATRKGVGLRAIFVHNAAVLAIGAQILVIYMTSGFAKASGGRWYHGTAMYLISNVDCFSLPSTRFLFSNPFVTTLACYGTVFFQVWFPIALFSRWRPLWVAIGILMHVGIAVTMGLIPFSTVMIGLELFLLSDATFLAFASRGSQMVVRFRGIGGYVVGRLRGEAAWSRGNEAS